MMTRDSTTSTDDWLRLIDAWVARAEGFRVVARETDVGTRFMVVTPNGDQPVPPYTTSDALARPIIQREGIEFEPHYSDPDGVLRVLAWTERRDAKLEPSVGATESEAGMYCYVALKFGHAPFDGASPVSP